MKELFEDFKQYIKETPSEKLVEEILKIQERYTQPCELEPNFTQEFVDPCKETNIARSVWGDFKVIVNRQNIKKADYMFEEIYESTSKNTQSHSLYSQSA